MSDSVVDKPWLTRRRGKGFEIPLLDRFWEKVDKRGPDECWPWLGAINGNGYGTTWDQDKRRIINASHVALLTLGIVVPPGMCALHSCDNPPCVNPSHLHVGTKGENNKEKALRGRSRSVPRDGANNPSAKLTAEDVVIIRSMRASGSLLKEIATKFGVTSTNICYIVNGKKWRK